MLDPFCGCGTTVHAAEKLGRRWIGIDITHLSIGLIEHRLRSAFPGVDFKVHGTPKDLAGARSLFEKDGKTKKQFEIWAVTLIGFPPQAKKGADGGFDAVEWFGPAKKHRAIVSVRGGKVGQPMVDALEGVLTKEKAQIGIFLTLEEPTKVMRDYAASAGLIEVPGTGLKASRVQIVTIKDALDKGLAVVNLPLRHGDTFKAAPKEQAKAAERDLFG